MHGLLEQWWLATASEVAALWGKCDQHSPHPCDCVPEAAPQAGACGPGQLFELELLSLRCVSESYSTFLWPPAMCNHSCIKKEWLHYERGCKFE